MNVSVTMKSGTVYTVGLTLIDQVAFERHFRHDAAVGNAEDSPLTFAAYAAWHALRREQELFNFTWDEFIQNAISVGIEEDSHPFPDTSSD